MFGKPASSIVFFSRHGRGNNESLESVSIRITLGDYPAVIRANFQRSVYTCHQQHQAKQERLHAGCSSKRRWPTGVRTELLALPQCTARFFSTYFWYHRPAYAGACLAEQRG